MDTQTHATTPEISDEHSKLPSILLVIQLLVVFLFGCALSTSAPEAWFNSSGSFFLTISPLVLFPLIGILGLVFGVRAIGKKNYSIIAIVLLITSIGFTTIGPADFVSRKIAGLFNYQWTNQAAQQRTMQAQQHMQENQIMQEQENQYYNKTK